MHLSGAMMMPPTRVAQVNWTNSWGSISMTSLTTIGGMGERWKMAHSTNYTNETKDRRG